MALFDKQNEIQFWPKNQKHLHNQIKALLFENSNFWAFKNNQVYKDKPAVNLHAVNNDWSVNIAPKYKDLAHLVIHSLVVLPT